jgi:hypothetical protein
MSILLRVEKCARCGGDHDEPLNFVPLDRPNEAWTHWTMCPNSRQPIMLRVQGGSHPDDAIMLHSLVASMQAEPGPADEVKPLPPPTRSLVDQIAEETGWKGKGNLADHVRSLVSRHRPDVLNAIIRALQGESLRLTGDDISHNLDSIALALVNYRDNDTI